MVCVVETGIPSSEAQMMVVAPEVSAANPPIGASLVIRTPMVFTIRQPPNIVPRAMTLWHERMIHHGACLPRSAAAMCPVETRISMMIPIVFCASLSPCASEYAPAETSWSFRKIPSTFDGVLSRTIQSTPTM